ncbi:MAG: hypothetical protein POG74_06255 [Acidocella sp.]|nr:hypothetical protein [Acidocella sp.]
MGTLAFRFRQTLSFTTALSLALPLLPFTAQAQTAAAPPSRVGQIAYVSGSVSFNGSGSGGWAAAAVNYPVAEGDSLYTQDGAQAAIVLNASKISLNSDTELQITQLSDSNLATTESQGEAVFTLTNLQPGQTFTITTPRASVTISQNGQYDIIAGDATNPTIVESLQGAATVITNAATLQVSQGQEAVLTGTDPIQVQLAAAQPSNFANRILAQTAPPPPQYIPPLVGQMTGVAELSSYGSWSQSPTYGAVWYPQVNPGWTPYREGHWANIAPWGWTWVEDEPWGFAPFHYGRWFHDHDRWGWAPAPEYSEGGDYGRYYQPVYAPAVVSFFGLGVGVGITAALLASHSVGWVPLAPNEPYYPYYHSSPEYVRRLNVVNVRNITVVNTRNDYYYGNDKNFAYNRLANHTAATIIPGVAMGRGEHVGQAGRPAPENILAAARPITPGANEHGPGGHPGAFLPPAPRPLAQIRPGVAPHPTAFAQQPPLRPGTVGHPPIESGANHLAQPPNVAGHPNFTPANPGFHAPPPPPANGAHPPIEGAPIESGANHLAQPPNVAGHPSFTPANPGFHAPPPPPANSAHPPIESAPIESGANHLAQPPNVPGHPNFTPANPGFHAPPPPPANGAHVGQLPPAQGFHPQQPTAIQPQAPQPLAQPPHEALQPLHPPAQPPATHQVVQPHPAMPQVQEPHPPMPQVIQPHSQMPQPRPPMAQPFTPPAQPPQMQQPHPQMQMQPPPRPQPPPQVQIQRPAPPPPRPAEPPPPRPAPPPQQEKKPQQP